MERWQDNLRRKRQRCDHRPGSKGAVVRAKGNATTFVIVKVYGSAVDASHCGSRSITRRQSPDMFAIALEMFGVPNRVLLLCISRSTAVLEIVDRLALHVLILDPAKIDPHVRQLVN